MNKMKLNFNKNKQTIGLWQAMANGYTSEICAGAGFDWLLIDGEHSPNTMQTLLSQLQALAPYPLEPIARPPIAEPVLIKQYLDIGFRTLLAPMVEDAAQARRIVEAMRFPPRGTRGVASATSRASGFGADAGYLGRAHEDVCLIVQIESRAALTQIEAIAGVEGVDALFIGPSDLAASLGHLGNPRHGEVQAAITEALARIRTCGKPAGIFALDIEDARLRLSQGINFVSAGTDIGLLARGARDLLRECRVPTA